MLSLTEQFKWTREQSLRACEPLAIEDYGLQAEDFTSPPKWHIAHPSWFFETFLLQPYLADYQPLSDDYAYLFNSYYNGIGEQFPRPQRGLLSRPTVAEVLQYRHYVDEHLLALLDDHGHSQRDEIVQRVTLGIQHEQQHQELFYTDLKYSLFCNPLLPVYTPGVTGVTESSGRALSWQHFDAGLVEIGHRGAGFAFDNETPRHKVYLHPFSLAERLVSNEDFLGFIEDGGYQRPELWLADGWATLQKNGWQRPHYWLQRQGQLSEYTLHGLQPLQLAQAVCHISAYEADAYARWAGCRLPTEMEWEYAAAEVPVAMQGSDDGCLQPRPCVDGDGMQQLYSDCWQWTSSAYSPYTGFSPLTGAIGEYNGKFMCNQLVLRGGSCVSSAGHVRSSYRNFFYPGDRWQFTGLRLAKSN